jgi:hypothetical protein
MNENAQNLLEAMAHFKWPEPQPVSYRLYYDDHGNPVVYSMEDLAGNYIEIDPQTYAVASFRVRVVDQKLIHVQPKIQVKKLRPNTETGTACSTSDVCVIVAEQQQHIKWSLTANDTN